MIWALPQNPNPYQLGFFLHAAPVLAPEKLGASYSSAAGLQPSARESSAAFANRLSCDVDPAMENTTPTLVAFIVALGLLGFALLFVIAVRYGNRVQRVWQQLAQARGWRLERPSDPGESLRLHGTSDSLTWCCSLSQGPGVITGRTAGSHARPLETVWRVRLPVALDGELNIFDRLRFSALQRNADAPLMQAMAKLSPGLGGQLLRTGLQAANAPAMALGEHFMLTSNSPLAQHFGNPQWIEALEQVSHCNGNSSVRVYLGGPQLMVALPGAIADGEQLTCFILSCTRLAVATRAVLQNQGADQTTNSGVGNVTASNGAQAPI